MDENEKERFALELLPNAAAQMRGALGNIKIAASRLAPPDARDRDSRLDQDAAILYQNYYRLLRLVNNLSDAVSLLETSGMPLRDEDLVTLVEELYLRAVPYAEFCGLELLFHCELLVCRIGVNSDALQRLLMNLLSNAFKFTKPGGQVVIELKQTPAQVLLSVTDTGCGIPQEMVPLLFDRYAHTERLDPPPHGLGLGLPICRHIARAHGGSLMAVSQEGKGTQITLSLPNRRTGKDVVSDLRFDYAGGFDPVLMELSDALPMHAFRQSHLD